MNGELEITVVIASGKALTFSSWIEMAQYMQRHDAQPSFTYLVSWRYK